uniref:Uncharacterized protein n=1 Tax=Rhizophora mucronata TaxID=61149 RepID=A0A2P2PWP4_RHIMU
MKRIDKCMGSRWSETSVYSNLGVGLCFPALSVVPFSATN